MTKEHSINGLLKLLYTIVWILFVGLLIFFLVPPILDLSKEVKKSTQTINEKVPQILDNTSKTATTLAELSDDIKAIRDLAGIAEKARDKTLVPYADSILDKIEAAENAKIGLMPIIWGYELKKTVSTSEWVTGARKEALYLAFRSNTREYLLTRLCQNMYNSDFYIQFPDESPMKLKNWLEEQQ